MATVLGFSYHNSNDNGVKNNLHSGGKCILFNSSELTNIPIEMYKNSWVSCIYVVRILRC